MFFMTGAKAIGCIASRRRQIKEKKQVLVVNNEEKEIETTRFYWCHTLLPNDFWSKQNSTNVYEGHGDSLFFLNGGK